MTYPGPNGSGPTVTYTYDLMSRLYSASDVEGNSTPGCGSTPPGGAVTWAQSAAYTPAGQLGALTRLNSVSANCSGLTASPFNEAWSFNNLNQTTEIDVSDIPSFPEPYLARYHYSSTADNGQIMSVDDGRLNYTIGYQYDALKRLVNASATGHWTQSYSYDGFGNLTAKSVPSGSSEPALPGVNSAKNWLTGVTYDANGNTTTGIGNQTLSYDIENRMIQSTGLSASTVYAYDEGNHRIAKTFGTNNPIVYFYGPDGKLMASFAATSLGLQSSSYRIYFGGMLLGTTTGSGSGGSALADRLGTYNPGYPYGTDAGLYGVPPDDAPYFATYTKDSATGFEYANQRYYSAGYGRFLTPDRARRSARKGNPGSWNRYTYSGSDPINRNDPSGLCDDIIGGIINSSLNSGLSGLATQIGANLAYPYANGSSTTLMGTIVGVAKGLGAVLSQGLLGANYSTLVAFYSILLSAQDAGPINIFAFSGGAQAFASAYQLLPANIQSRIQNVTYISPGSGSTAVLPGGTSGPPTVVLGIGETDYWATLLAEFPEGTKPPIYTPCYHDAACEIEYSGVEALAGSPCSATSTTSLLKGNQISNTWFSPFNWDLSDGAGGSGDDDDDDDDGLSRTIQFADPN